MSRYTKITNVVHHASLNYAAEHIHLDFLSDSSCVIPAFFGLLARFCMLTYADVTASEVTTGSSLMYCVAIC